MQRTYYEILGVPAQASAQEIRRRFRELARTHHPDVARDREKGHRAFVEISEAYQVLSDANRRAEYDLKLRDQARRLQTGSHGAGRATSSPGATGARPGAGPSAAPGPGARRPQAARPGASTVGGPAGGEGPGGPQRVPGAGPSRAPGGEGARPRDGNVPLMLRQAQSAYARGRFRDAIQLCQTVLSADRRNVAAYNILGDIYRVQGRVEQAIEMYSMAIQLNPRDSTAEVKLNRLLSQERPAARPGPAAPESARAARLSTDSARRRLNQRMLVGSAGFSLALFFLMILNNAPNALPISSLPLISQWTAPMLWVMVLDGAIVGAVLSLTGMVRRMDEELIFPSLSRGAAGGVPIGLLLFVTGALFFYLAGLIYTIVAAMQDSFSASVIKLIFATLSLVCAIALLVPPDATRQVLLFGGNVVFLSMLVGWLLGDLFRPSWA
jgi:tetratricopeptide (TPR) repeat protein